MTLDLTVDLAIAIVDVLVGPGIYQKVLHIVGQPFINHSEVILVVREPHVRLFNKSNADLPQVDSLPTRKVVSCPTETVVIPPCHLGHFPVNGTVEIGHVYVELQQRLVPGKPYMISRCITKCQKGALSVVNVSDSSIKFLKGAVVARGDTCVQYQPGC